MTFLKNISKVKFTAWLKIGILIIRWITITFFTLLEKYGSVEQLLPDMIAFFAVIILLFLGTKVKNRISNE